MRKTILSIGMSTLVSVAVLLTGIRVPASHAVVVQHVQGQVLIKDTKAGVSTPQLSDKAGYALSDLRDLYDITPLYDLGYSGRGQTVALYMVGADQQEVKSDLELFSEKNGLPPADIEFVYPDGINTVDAAAALKAEPILDVTYVHAIAPAAKIVCVIDRNMGNALEYIGLMKKANIVSSSYVLAEPLLDFRTQLRLDKQLERMAKNGVTVFSGSGDWGASDQLADVNGHLPWANYQSRFVDYSYVNIPPASAWVTGVGGTVLYSDETNRYTEEQAWPSSGGGYSEFTEKPDWQSNKGIPKDAHMRAVPDVAFTADLNTSMPIYHNGKRVKVAGTSIGGPAWAGIIALANEVNKKPLGFLNPKLYQIAASDAYKQVFHDVTQGSNGFTAGANWDAVTGLGSPDVYHLVQALTVGLDRNIPQAAPPYELPLYPFGQKKSRD
ncbi:MAG: S53 family peptidase [Tumebacillaceae bacterium]